MIQILGLRSHFDDKRQKERKYDAFFSEGWSAPSVADLFEDIPKYLEQIPKKHRWNLFLTPFQAGPNKRQFISQDVLAFDVDGIEFVEGAAEQYLSAFCDALSVPETAVAQVFTGNGMHFYIWLAQAITEASYFETHRPHYKALCVKLDAELRKRGLSGALDPSIFEARRLLRLPGTENRKPGKATRQATLLRRFNAKSHFSIPEKSGLPLIPTDQHLGTHSGAYPRPDNQTIMGECEFLKHCAHDADEIDEPELYAALSIIGRLENGPEVAEQVFAPRFGVRNHGGSAEDLAEKLRQAVEASGPRTCSNINQIWGQCRTCPHFEKVNSPINIRGEKFVATELQGFHDISLSATGKPVLRPNYRDLARYFDQRNPYRVIGSSRLVYRWNGKHYRLYEDSFIEGFAEEFFNPPATRDMRGEFKSLIQCTKLMPPEWFQDTTARKINFQNGVLDMDTMRLVPHSPELGFRYVLDYDYDPNAKAPVFEKFLHDISLGDESIKRLLLEFSGYSLSSDDIWEQRCLVLLGEGSNGKSTFMQVLRALAGKHNYSSMTFSDLKSEYGRQKLDGALFNIAEETPTRALMESSLFKNLVGGGEIQVRTIYKSPYTIRNRAKFIFATNELLQAVDTTEGFFRRFLIIPFRARFSNATGNRDPFIEQKLKKELPGIFNLAMAGYQRMFKARAFSESHQVQQELDQFRLDTDTVRAWVEENITVQALHSSQAMAPIPEVYQAYAQDMDRMNIKPVNAIVFGRKLGLIIPDFKARVHVQRVGGKPTRVLLDTTRVSGEKF